MITGGSILIRGGAILKGKTLEPVTGEALLIEDGRIAKIVPEKMLSLKADWQVIDAAGFRGHGRSHTSISANRYHLITVRLNFPELSGFERCEL